MKTTDNDMDTGFGEKWNLRFMNLAKHISNWSKDESTKVGCVIVGPDKEIRSLGYNGFPRGVDDTIAERQLRPLKYEYYEHAERNAIYNANLSGSALRGCTLYVTLPPCPDCARGIIQSGIRHVYFLKQEEKNNKNLSGWRKNICLSLEMFDEAGVKYTSLNRENGICDVPLKKLFNLVPQYKLDNVSNITINKYGHNHQISMCIEELGELSTELLLNNSAKNTAAETADVYITLNHITYGYDIRKSVITARNNKIQNPQYLTRDDERLISFFALQKELLKNINRGFDNIPEIINRTADAYVALIKSIVERNNMVQVRKIIQSKIERTIERVKTEKAK